MTLINWNCLQWGRSNLVDPAGWPKIGLLNWLWGAFCTFFLGKTAQNTEFTKFSSVRTPEFTKSVFFGIGPDPVSSESKAQWQKNQGLMHATNAIAEMRRNKLARFRVSRLSGRGFRMDQKGPHKRGIHGQGDFWKFPLETSV